jgi:hypothetical protein
MASFFIVHGVPDNRGIIGMHLFMAGCSSVAFFLMGRCVDNCRAIDSDILSEVTVYRSSNV